MRANAEPEAAPRRRRDVQERERSPGPRRARRRRQTTPWLQRNALSVAAVSLLVALLGLGFGLLQMINRPEPAAALLALQTESTAPTASLNAAVIGPSGALSTTGAASAPAVAAVVGEPRVREIQASARVIEPNYTVEAGDTLGRIAVRFNTTVERIQALNNLSDPRTLRIGARLVIPPPL
jgi:nucleoid-associated protein YgaU